MRGLSLLHYVLRHWLVAFKLLTQMDLHTAHVYLPAVGGVHHSRTHSVSLLGVFSCPVTQYKQVHVVGLDHGSWAEVIM